MQLLCVNIVWGRAPSLTCASWLQAPAFVHKCRDVGEAGSLSTFQRKLKMYLLIWPWTSCDFPDVALHIRTALLFFKCCLLLAILCTLLLCLLLLNWVNWIFSLLYAPTNPFGKLTFPLFLWGLFNWLRVKKKLGEAVRLEQCDLCTDEPSISDLWWLSVICVNTELIRSYFLTCPLLKMFRKSHPLEGFLTGFNKRCLQDSARSDLSRHLWLINIYLRCPPFQKAQSCM